MRKHRLMLDYDKRDEWYVRGDATQLINRYPELGDYFVVEPSGTPFCWHVKFPKSELEWDEAVAIAEESSCDKDWLEYCKKYKCFAIKTVISKVRQPDEKVVNPPVEVIKLPFSLMVVPISDFELRCCLRLCESIKDKEWVWRYYTQAWDMRTRVEIGCRDSQQALRRLKWLSDRIKADFEVKKND